MHIHTDEVPSAVTPVALQRRHMSKQEAMALALILAEQSLI